MYFIIYLYVNSEDNFENCNPPSLTLAEGHKICPQSGSLVRNLKFSGPKDGQIGCGFIRCKCTRSNNYYCN